LIFTTSEMLTKKFRNTIDSAFNTHLFDQYGSVEFGTFAWECPEHNGYHIDAEDIVVEFLNKDQNVAFGEQGEIVVTSLSNYVMPLIRYSLGDIGIPSDERCSCSRGLPKMEIICGRKDEFLCLPSGKLISPRNVGSLEYVSGITSFKIIQERKDRIVVQVVKGKDFSLESINKIKEVILIGCFRENVDVIVKPVTQIDMDASGKNRMIISKVN
jgi:phenylacetate-CoA ligase